MTSLHEPAISWRERLHSLPHGEDLPDPPWLRFALFAVCAPFLALASLFLALFAGAAFGLSLGIGPEQTGGAAYALPGASFSLVLAACISFIATSRGASRSVARYLFYCISAPAWVIAVVYVASIDFHTLLQHIHHK